MKVNITYPAQTKRSFQRHRLLDIVRWPVLAAACCCPVVNILAGGKAWSAVALMGLYSLWTLVLSPDLVEYNRISQPIKGVLCACVLLVLIDVLLAPGWVWTVVPLVVSGGLIAACALFFSDLERQKQNMQPLLLLIVLALTGSIVGLCLRRGQGRWTLIVMGALALGILIAAVAALRFDFIRELKRRFHTI